MQKELCVTTDFLDDLLSAGRHFTKRDLDAMMAYSASLGASRHEWILDTMWTLYRQDSPAGFDLLQAACDAAHRYGMRFDVVFKPFEGALSHPLTLLPYTLPRPEGVPVLDEAVGQVHAVRPFVAAHPEMRMARHPDDAVDPGGRIAAIRLVKNDEAPLPFVAEEDISIYTSSRNGGFKRYEGPVTVKEQLEWRAGFPYRDRQRRVLTLGDLDLGADTRFVVVRCEKSSEAEGTFTNAIEQLVELVNERGEVIPSMPSRSRGNASRVAERIAALARLGLTEYTRHPDVNHVLQDTDYLQKEAEGMFIFHSWWEDIALDKVGEVAVARGKPRYVYGVLNPTYPEVRQDWLDHIQFCVDRGADSVNIRFANHNRPYEPWSYGFNEPVIAAAEYPGNAAEASWINSEGFTQFLREAAELLHGQGKELGLHVHAQMLRHDDRAADNTPLPRNVAWDWEKWLHDFADYVEFRGASSLRPENVREVTDQIGLVARRAGIPFIYQSARGAPMHYDGPHPNMACEMERVREHPDVSSYNLYEGASFSRINDDDVFEGSPDIADLVQRHW